VALLRETSAPHAVAVARNSVAVIDPRSGRIVGDVRVGAQPRGIAVGAGGVWVANTADETVTGIDPDTLRPFKTYGVGGAPLDIAIRDEILWVALDGEKAVARIDVRSQAIQTFSVPGNASVYAVDVGHGSVWVGAATVYRLDPRSGAIVQKPPTDCCVPIDVIVTPHSIWTNAFQNAVRLNPVTLRQQVTVPLNSLEEHFAYGSGAVWVCASRYVGGHVKSNVWKLDDVSGATQAQTQVGDYATAIATGARAVWVASHDAGTVSKLDPSTGELLDTISVGGHPDGIAVGLGRVWVSID
jgi:YVTN family beta-propeller protein